MITPFVLLHFYPPPHDKTSPALSLTVSMPEALHRTHKETSHLGTLKNRDHFVSIVVRQVFSFFIQNCFWFVSIVSISVVSLLVWLTRDQPSVTKQGWRISVFFELVSEKVPPFCVLTAVTKETTYNSFGLFFTATKKTAFCENYFFSSKSNERLSLNSFT